MKNKLLTIILTGLLCFYVFTPNADAVRLKDMTFIKGVRSNQLIGYGLVVGLNGSGDRTGTKFTVQSMVNMLERMGIHVNADEVSLKNVAAVMVTADLPPFAKIGQKIDIVLSTLGDCKSLQGGTLVMTPLMGVDRQIYALAQGAVAVGGYSAAGAAGGGVSKNHPTVGRISNGASVEREVPLALQGKQQLTFMLKNPDFTTAIRVRNSINERFGQTLATTQDSGSVTVEIPETFKDNEVQLIAAIENIQVMPDTIAKIVVNEKTGTVVIGENVRISTVAVAHGNLSIQIKEATKVSQPSPFAPTPQGGAQTQYPAGGGPIVAPGGQTVVSPMSDVYASEEANQLLLVPGGSTIGELVRALNAIGVSPRDLITIFLTIKAAGALQADLEIL